MSNRDDDRDLLLRIAAEAPDSKIGEAVARGEKDLEQQIDLMAVSRAITAFGGINTRRWRTRDLGLRVAKMRAELHELWMEMERASR